MSRLSEGLRVLFPCSLWTPEAVISPEKKKPVLYWKFQLANVELISRVLRVFSNRCRGVFAATWRQLEVPIPPGRRTPRSAILS